MPLVDVEFSTNGSALNGDIAEFLRDVDERITDFFRTSRGGCSGFVPSDYGPIYEALRVVADENLAAGGAFCEWGSGFGVVSSMAAMLDFDSCGIEIERDLVDEADRLAEDYDLSVEFIHGSFIPPGGAAEAEKVYLDDNDGFSWLVTDTDSTYDELGRDPEDFDLIFAYPWPDEERVINNLFEAYAAKGALLLTQEKFNSLRLQRKVGGNSRPKRLR